MSRNGALATGEYRQDIQGLRALAVLLVVVYHIWLGRVSGGVDVFLLISALLLTLSFTRKVESGRAFELIKYWLSVARRLLPAAAVVLVAVLVGSYAILPEVRWPQLFEQTWASLSYWQNWYLADQAMNYQGANFETASPLQHFWSLSIQGQIFILWPLIFAGAALLAKALGFKFRLVAAAMFAVIFAGSLAFSIWETSVNQPYAYFDTRARLYEFAFGSLLALTLPYLRLPQRLKVIAGWAGLVLLLSCGLMLSVDSQFPGVVALWPVLAASLILVSGPSTSRFGVDRLLSMKPLVKLGDSSYALYLWHWPLLIFFMAYTRTAEVSLLQGSFIIALSLLLAIGTSKLVEKPLRTWDWPTVSRRGSLVLAGACAALVAVPLMGWQQQVAATQAKAQTQSEADNPGAAALDPNFEFTGSPDALVRPVGSAVDQEWVQAGPVCNGEFSAGLDPRIPQCQQVGDPATAQKKIVVIGNSHAQQWMGALAPAAEKNNWAVASMIKFGCRYGGYAPEFGMECNAYIDAAREAVLKVKPDLVIMLGTLTEFGGSNEQLIPELVPSIEPFRAAGIPVMLLRDNPRFDFNVPECVAKQGEESEQCQRTQSELFAQQDPYLTQVGDLAGVDYVDMTAAFCPEGVCRPVIGNVLVYMDENHVTNTYMNTLAPVIEKELFPPKTRKPGPIQ